jgi:endoglucanase
VHRFPKEFFLRAEYRVLAKAIQGHWFASMMGLTLTLGVWSQSGCRAQQPWPLWEAYTQHFIDNQGRVIDHTTNDRSTSEGQAYALFFALVDNDRAHFDKILQWTETNMAGGDLTLHLPGWSWGKTATGWGTIDPNPAADADLWLAYSLLEAGRLWREPRYTGLGRAIAARIATQEVVLVPNFGTTLIAGPSGFHPSPDTWIVNPSYMPLPILSYLAANMPHGPWGEVRASYPSLVTGGTSTGFAMDWVSASPLGLRPVVSPSAGRSDAQEAKPQGSYDAIRVYLWAGLTDPATPEARHLQDQLGGMAGYLKGALTPPLAVGADGHVSQRDSPPGFSAAVIPFLLSRNLKPEAKSQMDRLLGTKDPSTGLYGKDAAYYDQNLALFSTGWTERLYHFDTEGRLHPAWN